MGLVDCLQTEEPQTEVHSVVTIPNSTYKGIRKIYGKFIAWVESNDSGIGGSYCTNLGEDRLYCPQLYVTIIFKKVYCDGVVSTDFIRECELELQSISDAIFIMG